MSGHMLSPMTTTPHIDTVTVTSRDNPDYGKSWNTAGPTEWLVSVTWAIDNGTLDRTDGTGYVVKTKREGERLAKAIRAGVVFVDPTVEISVHGETYVSARSTVLARHLNADLTRLGY